VSITSPAGPCVALGVALGDALGVGLSLSWGAAVEGASLPLDGPAQPASSAARASAAVAARNVGVIIVVLS
jgi:hypothetical protein